MILLPLLAQAQALAIACAEPVTQSAITICATHELERADAPLKAQWSLTATAMREQDSARDVSRNEQPGHFATALAAEPRGGRLEPTLIASCKTKLTERRNEQLRALADRPR